MTQVGQIIEEEIQQAIAETWRQADEKMEEARRQADEKMKETWRQAEAEKEEAIQSAEKNVNHSTARKMLACGISIDQILQCIDGLTRGELEMMK